MRFPTVTLEGKRLPRLVLSIKTPPASRGFQEIFSLMHKAYQIGAWCFDLPTTGHVHALKELRGLTDDEGLIGIPHVDAADGLSLSGIPLRRAESKVIGTLMKSLFPSDLVKKLKETGAWRSHYFFPTFGSFDVFTQKEIDRIRFDSPRFDKGLAPFQIDLFPLLVVGGKYTDWVLGLGRIDLLRQMIDRMRAKTFVPILSGQWATFFLPKVKTLEAAAYAIPINKQYGFFEHTQACDLVKKFDKPVISLDPLAGKAFLENPEEAFSFLFEELKVHLAIVEVSSEADLDSILKGIDQIPSLRPHRKT